MLISGASTGRGEDLAQLLAGKGWLVFAGVRREEDANKLRGYHSNITPVILDVTKEDQVSGAIEIVRKAVGESGLDVLVNNAAVTSGGPMEVMSMEVVYSLFEVNVFGVMRLTQAALPLIRLGEPGRVITVGSLASDQYAPYLGAYNGTKAALWTLTEALRRELKPFGIKVVYIKPGPVETKLAERGIASMTRYVTEHPPGSEGHRLYGKDMEQIEATSEKIMRLQVKPSVVSAVIYQAMTAKEPKNCYYDTWTSYFSNQVYYWMPVSQMDKLVGDIFFVKD